MQYYLKNVKDVLTAVCSEEKGLTQGEAEKRLAQNGKNKLAIGPRHTNGYGQNVYERRKPGRPLS